MTLLSATKTVRKENIGDDDAPVWRYLVIYRDEYDDGRVDIRTEGALSTERLNHVIAGLEAQLADWQDTKAQYDALIAEAV